MRGLRVFVGVLFGLSVALAGCESTPKEPTPDPAIAASLSAACAGRAVTGAGTVQTSGVTANHLVLLNSDGTTSDEARWLPKEWAPYSLSDAELVACWQTEESRAVVQVCPYTGSDITRYSVSRDLTVFAAQSGSTVADFTITAQPRSCHQTEDADLTELEGSIDTDIVAAHLVALAQLGRFVDPDPDDWFDPDWTLAPDWTPAPADRTLEPGETDQPDGQGQAAELRQALADGLISVTGTGDGLARLDLELTSETDVDLDVTIEVGTLLEPGARGTQRMVVTEPQTIWLAAYDTTTTSLDVACVEMHQDQPTGDDTFQVLDTSPTSDMLLLLANPDFADATGRVRQFAVWTISNNPRRNDYVGITSGFDIFGSGPDDEEMAAIRDLFDAAGIDTSKYRALK